MYDIQEIMAICSVIVVDFRLVHVEELKVLFKAY